jgi:transposase
MGDLDGVDAADLRAALADVDDAKAALRLSVGLAYANGVGPAELAEWYGLSRSTVYDWLGRVERLAEEPAEAALLDADRPGRPAKLSAGERERLATTLEDPPGDADHDADVWTTGLVAEHVAAVHGIEYTHRHVRDLLRDLGFGPTGDGGWRRRP